MIPEALLSSKTDPLLPNRLSCGSPGPIQFHEFAKKNGFKNPTDAANTSLNLAAKMDTDFFSYVHSRGYGTHFANHMGGYRQGRPPWMSEGFFPVKERLIDGADTDPESSFLVDLGGSSGHDLAEFNRYWPDAPGKLVLQDLPVVIDQTKDFDKSITPMKHDFFTEQPLKGNLHPIPTSQDI